MTHFLLSKRMEFYLSTPFVCYFLLEKIFPRHLKNLASYQVDGSRRVI